MITSLDRAKTFLNIPSSDITQDEQILMLIELTGEWVKEYCGDTFIDGFPAGYELNALKIIAYNREDRGGKQGESLRGYSVTFAQDYPADILRGLKRKVRFV